MFKRLKQPEAAAPPEVPELLTAVNHLRCDEGAEQGAEQGAIRPPMRRRRCRQRWPLCPKAPPELTKRPRTARMKEFWNFSAGSGCNSTPVTGEMGRESWIRAPQTAQSPSEASADASPPHRRWLSELSACRSPTETFQRLPPDRTDVMRTMVAVEDQTSPRGLTASFIKFQSLEENESIQEENVSFAPNRRRGERSRSHLQLKMLQGFLKVGSEE